MEKIAKYINAEDFSSEIRNIEQKIEQKLNLQMNLSYNKFVDGIVLHKIVVPKENRNSGVGTQAMHDLCVFADSKKLNIFLTPSSDFGGNKSKLGQFYKRFGFENYSGYKIQEKLIRRFKWGLYLTI